MFTTMIESPLHPRESLGTRRCRNSGRRCRSIRKADVAELTEEAIEALNRDEMIEAIHASQAPWLQTDYAARLEFCDSETLERLVYLARRCCRLQGY